MRHVSIVFLSIGMILGGMNRLTMNRMVSLRQLKKTARWPVTIPLQLLLVISRSLIISLGIISLGSIFLLSKGFTLISIPLVLLLILFCYLGYIIRIYSIQIRNITGIICRYNYMVDILLKHMAIDSVNTKGTLGRQPTGKNGLKRWKITVNKTLLLPPNYATISTNT